ncbi:MAG: hypothetical protein HQL58_10415 [Magnetococcales bacterium]|nr:hypothetical protein [Magnetococcales bacterium]
MAGAVASEADTALLRQKEFMIQWLRRQPESQTNCSAIGYISLIWPPIRLWQRIEPVDAAAVSQKLRKALKEADLFVRAMPVGKEGLLFLKNGLPVQPQPEQLAQYTEHTAGDSACFETGLMDESVDVFFSHLTPL